MTKSKYAADDATDPQKALQRLGNPNYGHYTQEQRAEVQWREALEKAVQDEPQVRKPREIVLDNRPRGDKHRFSRGKKHKLQRK